MIIYNFPANTILMSGTRRVSGTDVKANRSISIRFSEELFDKINAQWKKDGFANRTALVEAACNLYFDSLSCPRCGNRNHKNSLYCSICGNTLNPLHEIKEDLSDQFLSIKKHQANILTFEKELQEDRRKIIERVSSMHINNDLEEKLLSMIHNLSYLEETGSLEVAIKNSEGDLAFYPNSITHPLFERYSKKLETVTKFFESPSYLTNNPPLSLEQVKMVKAMMTELEEIQNHYLLNVLNNDKMVYISINEILDSLSKIDESTLKKVIAGSSED